MSRFHSHGQGHRRQRHTFAHATLHFWRFLCERSASARMDPERTKTINQLERPLDFFMPWAKKVAKNDHDCRDDIK
jgi:hypothetical protein